MADVAKTQAKKEEKMPKVKEAQVTEIKEQAQELLTEIDEQKEKLSPQLLDDVSEAEKETEKIEAKVEDLDSLRSELENSRKDIEKWKNLADTHSKSAGKLGLDLREARVVRKNLNLLGTKVETLTQMVADIMDSMGTEELEEKPKKRRSEEYLQAIREKEKDLKLSEADIEKQRTLGVANQIISLTQPTGMELDKAPELREAYIRWLSGDYDNALEEVKKVVGETKPRKSETEAELRERLKKELKKEILQEMGATETETGQPKGEGTYTFTKEQIEAMPTAEFEQKRDLINKARREDKIK